MSKRFVDTTVRPAGTKAALCACLALLLAACGSSTPRQADVDRPRETTQSAVAVSEAREREPAAASAAPAETRRARRGEAVPPSAAVAAADPALPVPEVALAAHERALAAMRADDWLTAQLELEQLTAEHPSYPGPYVNLALVYLHDARADEARAALARALALDPGHPAANTQLGILLREEGEFAQAEAAYRRALATDPDHALAHYNLGVLLDLYLKRPAEALAHYEAYQGSLAEPNETVGRWIIDLRRRSGNSEAARVAQGDSQ